METLFGTDFPGLFFNSLYLLALINPISKVFLLSYAASEHSKKEVRDMALRSSLIAFIALVMFAAIGQLILDVIFKINLYSLKVTGGIIFFSFGYKAISKGKFFEINQTTKLVDISLVPLVYPMMAGPATITAVLAISTNTGLVNAGIITFLALSMNLLVMLFYSPISTTISKYTMTGPLIRLTGLIVSTIAVQMVLEGLAEWIRLI